MGMMDMIKHRKFRVTGSNNNGILLPLGRGDLNLDALCAIVDYLLDQIQKVGASFLESVKKPLIVFCL